MKINFIFFIMYVYICTANGDISFGSNIIRPTFQFIGTLTPTMPVRVVTIEVISDDILEGQEIGLLTIAPSTAFDGFAPRFQSVRIIIDDSNSECTMYFHVCGGGGGGNT